MSITQEDLDKRFGYHPPTTIKAKTRYEHVREAVRDAAGQIAHLTPAGREQSLAITKIEEAMFWAMAAIAREGA